MKGKLNAIDLFSGYGGIKGKEMSSPVCSECKNKDIEMFSEASNGKKYLCLKCYHTFYKPGESSVKAYYSSKSRDEKMLSVKTNEVPNAVYVELNFLRERLNKLEEFCKKRGLLQ